MKRLVIYLLIMAVFMGCAAALKTPYGTVDFALTNEDVLKIVDIATRIPRGTETTRRAMIMTTEAGQKVLLQVGGPVK